MAVSTENTPATLATEPNTLDRMHVVIVGHVDHGKSTVIGRLLADTGSLPEGKLEQVRAQCERNARPFEYAFLLDALKNEQAQGITIDTARSFFKTARRHYIISDAPGHIEFLKNMITGAARAEAALLVIDALEGIQENSKRHGYIVSMLGVKQLVVLVNKMDLVDYSQEVFERIQAEYGEFLAQLGVHPQAYIPIAAREGVNLTRDAKAEMPWYTGPTLIDQVDLFEKPTGLEALPFRMAVQDIYKFTAQQDDRRIVSGTIDSGSINVGEEVLFLPSGKRSHIKAIESFAQPPGETAFAGQAVGFTMTTQIYIKPGELMVKAGEPVMPHVGRRFRANIFWMGRAPLVKGKDYKLKLGAARVAARLADIHQVLDASELSSIVGKQQIDRHDVGECVFETLRPIAFDERNAIEPTGRFVLIDDYEIAGCGVVLEALADSDSMRREQLQSREFHWEKGKVGPEARAEKNGHTGKFVVFTGLQGTGKRYVAWELEKRLFAGGAHTYYFGVGNMFEDLDTTVQARSLDRDAHIQRLGEMARVMTDAGLIFITTLTDVDDYDLQLLKEINAPNELLVVHVGENIYNQFPIDLHLPSNGNTEQGVQQVMDLLGSQRVLIDFSI